MLGGGCCLAWSRVLGATTGTSQLMQVRPHMPALQAVPLELGPGLPLGHNLPQEAVSLKICFLQLGSDLDPPSSSGGHPRKCHWRTMCHESSLWRPETTGVVICLLGGPTHSRTLKPLHTPPTAQQEEVLPQRSPVGGATSHSPRLVWCFRPAHRHRRHHPSLALSRTFYTVLVYYHGMMASAGYADILLVGDTGAGTDPRGIGNRSGSTGPGTFRPSSGQRVTRTGSLVGMAQRYLLGRRQGTDLHSGVERGEQAGRIRLGRAAHLMPR